MIRGFCHAAAYTPGPIKTKQLQPLIPQRLTTTPYFASLMTLFVALSSLPACGDVGPSEESVLTLEVVETIEIIAPDATERPVAFLTDGDVFVVLEPTSVRIFNQDGEMQNEFGRLGEGPGEFQQISGGALLGDSLVVLDSRRSTLSLWHIDGSFGRLALIPFDIRYPNFHSTAGRLPAGGDVVGVLARANIRLDGPTNVALMAVSLGESPSSPRTLREVGGPEWVGGNLPMMGWRDPFGPRDVSATGPEGSFIVGVGTEPCVTVVPLGEEDMEHICWDPPRPISGQLPGPAWLEKVAEPGQSRYRALLEAQQPSRNLPLYDRLWGDTEGRIWIRTLGEVQREYTPQLPWLSLYDRMPAFSWDIRDRGGRLVGRIDLPGWFDPVNLQGDVLFGVWILPDGRRALMRYQLSRSLP